MLQFQKGARELFSNNKTFQEFVNFDQFLSSDTPFFPIKLRPHVKEKKNNKKLCVFYTKFLNWRELKKSVTNSVQS